MYCGFKAKPTLCPQIKTASCQSCQHLYADRPLHLEPTQQESVRTDMVDSEQVLGGKAPMGLVLVLLLSSLLGPLGQVQAQDCEKPMRDTMSLTDEDIQKEHFPSGSFVTFECAMGYRSTGGSGKTTCVAGTWIPSTLSCEMVRCKAPFIPNGSQKSGARPPYVHRSLVEYECNPGFKMEGEGVMTCLLNSTWSSTPECKAIIITTTPTTTTTTPTTMTPKTPATTQKDVPPVDPTSFPVRPVDPTSSPVPPVDPTSSPVLTVDPTSSPDDSKTWSQSWWFIGLIIVILIIIISLTFWLIRKKRGSQSLRAPVPVEEDKIL
ncbi:membrane cofactor protein-like [Gadus macrocephalus]|uniref:membrane cofactor protein-like n=1 Tax=Gadus macrocephalus TaxID=80720 RepID=UPI0028CB8CD5|nr:membrane cofactor protein-like [Gadus macrocephalus]